MLSHAERQLLGAILMHVYYVVAIISCGIANPEKSATCHGKPLQRRRERSTYASKQMPGHGHQIVQANVST